jgi:cobalt-zinc-cadmium resistance protein CzcA
MDLRELQDWVITPKLLTAPGVADITNFGGLVRQFHVIVNPALLDKYGFTIKDLADKIAVNNSSTGGNVIARGSSQLAVRSVGRITKREDIESIVLDTRNGTPIFVRDVASVEIGALPPSGVLGYTEVKTGKDVDDGIEGIVLMRRGENPSEVLKAVKERIEELNTRVLPKGVRLRIAYDRTDLVNSTLTTVAHTLLEGVSIVVLVLLVFLGSLRSAIAVAITIPLSLAFAFVMMKVTGIPANLLSLGAIDFGIIVDAAVVMVESIARTLSHATYEERKYGTRRLIFTAAKEVQRQIVFAVLIIILAYLPLFTLQRVEGKLFSPMAYTLAFAIGGSLILSLTLVPVACSYLLGPDYKEWHNPVLAWLEVKYRALMNRSVRRPVPALIGALVLVVGAVFLGTKLGTEFLPELDEGGFNIRAILPAGVSLQEARKYPTQIRAVMAGHPQIRFAISQLGRNDDGTDPYGPSRIETLVQLQPYDTWPEGLVKKQLLQELKAELERKIPGASFSFSQPILDNVSEAVTGSAADLAVLVSGPDQTVLRNTANEILKQIRPIRGASESGLEQEGPQSQLVIALDRSAMARYGLNIADVNTVIELAIAGRPVSVVYEGERRFDITLRYTLESRASPLAIENVLITTPTGARITLGSVARVAMVPGQTIIAREDSKRQVGVRTNVRGRDQGGFVAEAQAAVAANVKLPAGYTIRWGGQFENLTRAKKRLILVMPITVALIFVVLFILFGSSPKYAAIVLTNVPFALVGGITALWLRGYPFNVSAGVGFISLFGVAVMSGVLLVSYINLLRTEQHYGLRAAVVEGATTQLRPIMMMMFVALIGLIPAARGTGIGSDIQRPLATVIVGGLLSALVLTLLVMPALYFFVEARALRSKRKRRTRAGMSYADERMEEAY